MCFECESLIEAINAYIAKADNDLEETLEDEGYAESKKSLDIAQSIEDSVTDALVEETDYIVNSFDDAVDLEAYAKKIWGDIKATDPLRAKLKELFINEFTEAMPVLIGAYLKSTDDGLEYVGCTKKTTDWIERWSEELAEIMELTSHNQIEAILETGLEEGKGVAEVARYIKDSGIRDEYYRARMTSLTEMLRAHSVAQQEAFMQSPAVEKKMWRHSGHYKNTPRQNHVDMDGQIVEKGKTFELVGESGSIYHPMYPRDSSLPPEESINCHCITQPVVSQKVLGLSLEERQRLQQEAIDTMDDEWEKELDEQQKAKAGS